MPTQQDFTDDDEPISATLKEIDELLGGESENELPVVQEPADTPRVYLCLYLYSFSARWIAQFDLYFLPIFFISMFPDSLITVIVWNLFNKFVCMAASSTIGSYLDQQSRNKVVLMSVFMQWFSLALSTFFFAVLINLNSSNPTAPNGFFGSMNGSFVFFILMISGVLGTVGAFALNKTVELDWIPLLTSGTQVSDLKTNYYRVTIACDAISPFLITLLLVQFKPLAYLITLSVINTILLIINLFLLRYVLKSRNYLNRPSERHAIQQATRNPFAVIWNNRTQLKKQGTGLLVIANGFRSLSVASPSHVILIAYLADIDIGLTPVAFFVGFGAFFTSALFGKWIYVAVTEKLGMFGAARLYFLLQCAFLIIAGGFFHDKERAGHYFFLVFIMMSSICSSGFTWSKDTFLLKSNVSESKREEMITTDRAVEQLAQLLIFFIAMAAAQPKEFVALVWTSVSSCGVGFLIFLVWSFIPACRNSVIV